MIPRTLPLLTVAVLAAACAPEAPNSPAAAVSNEVAAGRAPSLRWRAIDLGTLGGPAALALDVNDLGVVVGYCTIEAEPNTERACVWRKPGVLPPEPLPAAGPFSQASGINNRGDIAGLVLASNGLHAVLWPADGGLIDLGRTSSNTLPSVNRHGHVVWTMLPAVGETGPVRVGLYRDGVILDLGIAVPNQGGGFGSPAGISDDGLIAAVGGVYWKRNRWLPLPRPAYTTADLIPQHVTPEGDIVGQFGSGQASSLGLWWPTPQRVRDLGPDFVAYDVDRLGLLVGEGRVFLEGGAQPWVPGTYTVRRGFHALPLPDGYQSYGRASRISNEGWIVGYAVRPDGERPGILWNRAMVWVPDTP